MPANVADLSVVKLSTPAVTSYVLKLQGRWIKSYKISTEMIAD